MVSNKLISEALVNWELQDEKVSDVVFPETGEISDSAKYVGSNMVIKYTSNLGSVKKAPRFPKRLTVLDLLLRRLFRLQMKKNMLQSENYTLRLPKRLKARELWRAGFI